MVGDDLSELILNVLGIGRLATDASERIGGLVELALLDVETRRFGEESKTSGEDDGPEELDGDRDTVGASVTAVLGGVDNAVGKQDTDGDAELVSSNDGTTDLLGSNLGHVQDDDGGNETDTQTSNEATSDHDTEAGGRSLEDTTNGEDSTSENDSHTATNEISEITSNDGTEEGTVCN